VNLLKSTIYQPFTHILEVFWKYIIKKHLKAKATEALGGATPVRPSSK